MNNIRITCYHDIDKFLDYVKNYDVSENPFLSYAFLSVFFKFNKKGNFYFFDIYEGAKKIAIIPMECTIESKMMNTRYFRFIGYRQFNYSQYICKNDDIERVHEAFMEYLSQQTFRSLINFYDINDSTKLYQLLVKEPKKKKDLKLYLCPCLHFTENFDEFFKSVYSASKKRAELKKFQKKLSNLGDFKILNIANKKSYDANKKYLDQIYKVHAERFSKVYATSFFGSPKMRPYYSELIESLMRDEKGHISLLLMDDIVIAFIFCLTNGKTLIDWIPAFDPAYSKYSLGIVQYKMLFEKMCSPEVPYKIFDYSKGSSVYKRKWAKEETSNYQFVMQTSKQNIFSWVLYLIEINKFSFKCYLREKGVLELIKDTLGKIMAKKEDCTEHQTVLLNYVEGTNQSSPLKYSAIVNYPVETRRIILDALYQGVKLVSIEKYNDHIMVNLSK